MTHFTSMFHFFTPWKRLNLRLSYICMGYRNETLAIGMKWGNESTSLMSLNYSKVENKDSPTTSFKPSFLLSLVLAWNNFSLSCKCCYLLWKYFHFHFSYITKTYFTSFPLRYAVPLFPIVFVLYTPLFPDSLENRSQFFFVETFQRRSLY